MCVALVQGIVGCAVRRQHDMGPLADGRHPSKRHTAHEGRMALHAEAYHASSLSLLIVEDRSEQGDSAPLSAAAPAEVVSLGGCSDQSAHAGEGCTIVFRRPSVLRPLPVEQGCSHLVRDQGTQVSGHWQKSSRWAVIVKISLRRRQTRRSLPALDPLQAAFVMLYKHCSAHPSPKLARDATGPHQSRGTRTGRLRLHLTPVDPVDPLLVVLAPAR